MNFQENINNIIENNKVIIKNRKNVNIIRKNNNQQPQKDHLLIGYLKLARYVKIDDNNYDYMFNPIKRLRLSRNSISKRSFYKKPQDKGARVHFVNTGKGDAICIENNGEYAIIDFGGLKGSFEKYIKENIKEEKIKYAFITHFHRDHMVDFERILKAKDVENLILLNDLNDEMIDLVNNENFVIEKSNARHIRLLDTKEIEMRNAKFNVGEVSLEVLSPSHIINYSVNENSLVIKMDYKGKSILFTGDIEREGENALLDLYEDNKEEFSNVLVIKVAHHGSKKSSQEVFLEVFNNIKDFIISADDRCEWQNSDVIERLQKYGDVYKTYKDGNIKVDISKKGELEISTENSNFKTDIKKDILYLTRRRDRLYNPVIKKCVQNLHINSSNDRSLMA